MLVQEGGDESGLQLRAAKQLKADDCSILGDTNLNVGQLSQLAAEILLLQLFVRGAEGRLSGRAAPAAERTARTPTHQ